MARLTVVSSRRRLQLADRREMAWQLHKAGKTFRQIGAMLGYSKSSAQRDIHYLLAAAKDRMAQTVAEEQIRDAGRVEDVIRAWYPAATGNAVVAKDDVGGVEIATQAPDKDAAEIVLKAVDQKGKILGYQRQEVALVTATPLRVAAQVAADLSGLDEDSLDAIIRNLSAAARTGES